MSELSIAQFFGMKLLSDRKDPNILLTFILDFPCSVYISGYTPILPTAASDRIGRRRNRRRGTRAAATTAGIGGGRSRLPKVVLGVI